VRIALPQPKPVKDGQIAGRAYGKGGKDEVKGYGERELDAREHFRRKTVIHDHLRSFRPLCLSQLRLGSVLNVAGPIGRSTVDKICQAFGVVFGVGKVSPV
jgi:hypothetical protein